MACRWRININQNRKLVSINWCVEFHKYPEYHGSIHERQPAHSGRSRKVSRITGYWK